jgi:hypothetical protein
MLNDIARVYKASGWNTTLLCGSLPPESDGFSEIHQRTPYDRSSILNRLNSWRKFTQEVKQFGLQNSSRFTRVFLVSNPPSILYLTRFFKKLNKDADVDLLVYDLYPDILKSYAGKYINPFLFPIRSINRARFSAAYKIFTPSESLSNAVKAYYSGVVETIYNWVDVSTYSPVEKDRNEFLKQNNLLDGINVLYSGNLGSTHDVDTVLQSLSIIRNDKLRLLFIGHGEGMERLKQKAGTSPLLRFFEWQPEELFPHSIAAGDVALVSYLPGAEGYSIPSKLPYYFATGTPVIMIGNPDSELGKLITGNQLGWCVNNGEARQFADLISSLNPEILKPYRNRVVDFVAKEWSVTNAAKFYRT